MNVVTDMYAAHTGKAVYSSSSPHGGETRDRVLLKSGQQLEGHKQLSASQEQVPGAVGERQTLLGTGLSGAN